MLNLDEDKAELKVLAADTYDDLIRTNAEEAIDHLNRGKVRMTPMHFCLKKKTKICVLDKYVKDKKIFV